MKNNIKRILTAVLTAALLVCVLPGMNAFAMKVTKVNIPASGKMTLEELQRAFPKGAYWNHPLDQVDYTPYQVTDTPCDHWYDYEWGIGGVAETCNEFSVARTGGLQCAGFALMVSYLYNFGTGVDLDEIEITYIVEPDIINEIRVGDILRHDEHSVFVTKLLGNGVIEVGEGNYGARCGINWGRKIDLKKQDLEYAHIERLVGQLPEEGPAGTIYRLYNPLNGDHIYTVDVSERNDLLNRGWNLEKSPGMSAGPGNIPIYRLKNDASGEHLYTADKREKRHLEENGWSDELGGTPAFYGTQSGRAVYRLFNPRANTDVESHHYTLDKVEIKNLTTQSGWVADNDGKPAFYLN